MLNRFGVVALALVLLSACGGGSPSSPSAQPTPRPLWSNTGTGDMVFDMPADVARVHVTATYIGYSSNFVVWIGGTRTLLVNELIGTGWGTTTYDGVLLTGGGGVVSITNSSGVAWSFTEVR
jgi:hypothetical protein